MTYLIKICAILFMEVKTVSHQWQRWLLNDEYCLQTCLDLSFRVYKIKGLDN